MYAPEIILSDDQFYRGIFSRQHRAKVVDLLTKPDGYETKGKEGLHHVVLKVNPDSPAYQGSDSGCAWATRKLGYQSCCRFCDFGKCASKGTRKPRIDSIHGVRYL